MEKKHDSDLINIILPVYNSGPTIRRCIDSLFAQTYPRLRLIVIDDGSTDNGIQILRSLLSLAPFPVVILCKPNGGPGSARNEGLRFIKNSTEELVFFIDADDFISPNYLSLIHESLVNAQCNAVYNDINPVSKYEQPILMGGDQASIQMVFNNSWCGVNGKLFRLESIGHATFINTYYGEDLLFNFRVAASCEKVLFSAIPGYHLTTCSTSLRSKGNSLRALIDNLFVYYQICLDCHRPPHDCSSPLEAISMANYKFATNYVRVFSRLYYHNEKPILLALQPLRLFFRQKHLYRALPIKERLAYLAGERFFAYFYNRSFSRHHLEIESPLRDKDRRDILNYFK